MIQNGYEEIYRTLKKNIFICSVGEIGDIAIERKRRILNLINDHKYKNSFEVPGLVKLNEYSSEDKKVTSSGNGDGYVRIYDFHIDKWPLGVSGENANIRCNFNLKISNGHDKFAWAICREKEEYESAIENIGNVNREILAKGI